MKDMNLLTNLVNMADDIFSAESTLRKQRYDLVTAILRACGNEIIFKNNRLIVKYNNCWHDVDKIILGNDYEVYCVSSTTRELIDCDEVEEFKISNDDTFYGDGSILEVLWQICNQVIVNHTDF